MGKYKTTIAGGIVFVASIIIAISAMAIPGTILQLSTNNDLLVAMVLLAIGLLVAYIGVYMDNHNIFSSLSEWIAYHIFKARGQEILTWDEREWYVSVTTGASADMYKDNKFVKELNFKMGKYKKPFRV